MLNSKIRLIMNLKEKRSARRREGRFIVEGPHLVEAALERLDYVIYSENLPLVKTLTEKGFPLYQVSRQQFAELSTVETPQGIMAVVKQFDYQLKDLLAREQTLLVYCWEIQDPGNLGTIIRSAEAFGASGLLLSRGTVDLYNPKTVRATMGALFRLPLITVADDEKTIAQLKKKNVKIVATSPQAERNCFEVDLVGARAFLVGNEGGGLPTAVREMAAEDIRIPLTGGAESLNVGMATTVLLYEAWRQRWKKK